MRLDHIIVPVLKPVVSAWSFPLENSLAKPRKGFWHEFRVAKLKFETLRVSNTRPNENVYAFSFLWSFAPCKTPQPVVNCLVVIVEVLHPFPFRTRKLSPLTPMILRPEARESRSPPGSFLCPYTRSPAQAALMVNAARRSAGSAPESEFLQP